MAEKKKKQEINRKKMETILVLLGLLLQGKRITNREALYSLYLGAVPNLRPRFWWMYKGWSAEGATCSAVAAN